MSVSLVIGMRRSRIYGKTSIETLSRYLAPAMYLPATEIGAHHRPCIRSRCCRQAKMEPNSGHEIRENARRRRA